MIITQIGVKIGEYVEFRATSEVKNWLSCLWRNGTSKPYDLYHDSQWWKLRTMVVCWKYTQAHTWWCLTYFLGSNPDVKLVQVTLGFADSVGWGDENELYQQI